MILASAITLSCGGPGSGCRGPNCGRKRGQDLLQMHDDIQQSNLRDLALKEKGVGYSTRRLFNWQRDRLSELTREVELSAETAKFGITVKELIRQSKEQQDEADKRLLIERGTQAGRDLNIQYALAAQDEALTRLHKAISLIMRGEKK